MEKSQRIAVVPAEFGWSDVGSFAALSEVRELDDLGNVTEGEALVIDGHRNVVLARPRRPLALIGLDDVIAVDAGDAVLVCRRDRAQDVRRAVEELRRRGRETLL
jgi:mannose-1-phosphate guanylyltransferase